MLEFLNTILLGSCLGKMSKGHTTVLGNARLEIRHFFGEVEQGIGFQVQGGEAGQLQLTVCLVS